MIKTLKNDFIQLKIKKAGAEMISLQLRDDNTEYLWTGDPDYWGRHAPVLFPIVGRLKDNEYILDGETYKMTQHGFGRDKDFELITAENNRATYRLSDDENTLKKYPYQFQLDITYTLEENTVKINYNLKNTDSKEIHFSLGAHPGFCCPLFEDEEMEDYYLEFEEVETAETHLLEGPYFSGHSKEILNNEKILNLSPDLFANDALVFKDLKSNSITIKGKNHKRETKVKFSGFPYLGIWSPVKRSPFVCIEPWYGIADSIDTDKNFKTKKAIHSLIPDESFNCTYSISIK